MTSTEIKRVESRLDEILRRLDRIENLLGIEESLPDEDEIKAVLDYLKKRRDGKLKLVPVSSAGDM